MPEFSFVGCWRSGDLKRGDLAERTRDGTDHAVPVADGRLTKEARGRIPGALVALPQPAEIRVERQQDPDRRAERAGQVRDRRVRRDDEIELRDSSRRVGHVGNRLREVLNGGLGGKPLPITRAKIPLQRVPAMFGGENRQQRQQADAALGVIAEGWISAPDQPDPTG